MNAHKIARSVESGKSIFRTVRGPIKNGQRAAVILVGAIGIACFVLAANVWADEPTDAQAWMAAKNAASLVDFYRELHKAPELSLNEVETAKRIAEQLRTAGVKVTTDVGGHGVVGVLENGPGKVLMLRADMDGLPVIEQTQVPYASQVRVKDDRGATVGVMHACGHDLHMANLVGVAQYLASHRSGWSGTVVFVFQPAEERGAGAQAMLDDGLFARFPRPDFAVALHDAADLATGKLGYLPGYIQANVDSVDITVKGRGGHGAYPETTIDPIVIAARLVLDLQTIISREMKPTEPGVITVGSIHGGAKHNIISDECRLQITVRSYTPEARKLLLDGIRRKALAAAASAGAPEPEVRISESTPALYNDPELTERVVAALKGVVGEANLVKGERSMGGEDFACYGLAGVPVSMFKLGAVNQSRLDEYAAKGGQPPSLHSPLFYPDAGEALAVGIPAMVAVVVDLLPPQKQAPAQ